MTIYLHFDAAQLADGCGGLGEVGSTGQLVTMDEIRRWCGTAGSITVRPVIDLNGTRATRGYQPTDVMREQIALRDLTCVFPHLWPRRAPDPTTGKRELQSRRRSHRALRFRW